EQIAYGPHGLADRPRVLASTHDIGFMTGYAGICRRPFSAADGERKGIQNGRIHRSAPRRLDGFWGSAGKTFVRMQGHAPMPGGCEQGIGKFFLLLRLKE